MPEEQTLCGLLFSMRMSEWQEDAEKGTWNDYLDEEKKDEERGGNEQPQQKISNNIQRQTT